MVAKKSQNQGVIMTFTKDFDEIVLDFCGELPKKKDKINHGFLANTNANTKRQFQEEIEYIDSFNPYHHYHDEKIPHNLIQKMCHKSTHSCTCGREFILWVYVLNRMDDRYRPDMNFEMDQVLNYVRRDYYCFFCGQHFCILNGEILRIELKDKEVENYYHGRR